MDCLFRDLRCQLACPHASAVVFKKGMHVIAKVWDENHERWRRIAQGEAGVDDAEVIQKALNVGGRIIIKGTYYLDSELVVNSNSEVVFNNVKMIANTAMTNLIKLYNEQGNIILAGKLIGDGNNKANNFITMLDNSFVWIDGDFRFNKFTDTGLNIYKGSWIHLRGLYSYNQKLMIFANAVENLYVERVKADIVGDLGEVVIKIGNNQSSITPANITLRDIQIKGDGNQSVTPIVIGSNPGVPWIYGVTIENILVHNVNIDCIDILRCEEVNVTNFRAKQTGVFSVVSKKVNISNVHMVDVHGSGIALGDSTIDEPCNIINIENVTVTNFDTKNNANKERDSAAIVVAPYSSRTVDRITISNLRAYGGTYGSYAVSLYERANGVYLENIIADVNIDKIYIGTDSKLYKNSGTATITGDGTTTTFTVDITHGLVKDTVVAKITLDRDGSVDKIYLVDTNSDGFKETLRVQVTFASAPASGEEVPIYWEAEVI